MNWKDSYLATIRPLCCVTGCPRKVVLFNDGGISERCFQHFRPVDGDAGRIITVDADDEYAMAVWKWSKFYVGD